MQFLQSLQPVPGLERELLALHDLTVLQLKEEQAGGVIKAGGNPRAEYGNGNFHRVLDDIALAKAVPPGPAAEL
jgi:hypothetical protein